MPQVTCLLWKFVEQCRPSPLFVCVFGPMLPGPSWEPTSEYGLAVRDQAVGLTPALIDAQQGLNRNSLRLPVRFSGMAGMIAVPHPHWSNDHCRVCLAALRASGARSCLSMSAMATSAATSGDDVGPASGVVLQTGPSARGEMILATKRSWFSWAHGCLAHESHHRALGSAIPHSRF